MKLYYYYDKEADILYFSSGKPKAKTTNIETNEDVVLRLDPKTKKLKGFTILNFSRRLKRRGVSVELPVELKLQPVFS